MFRTINRPAFNLLRAMNFESSTGFSVISEEIQDIRSLYVYHAKKASSMAGKNANDC